MSELVLSQGVFAAPVGTVSSNFGCSISCPGFGCHGISILEPTSTCNKFGLAKQSSSSAGSTNTGESLLPKPESANTPPRIVAGVGVTVARLSHPLTATPGRIISPIGISPPAGVQWFKAFDSCSFMPIERSARLISIASVIGSNSLPAERSNILPVKCALPAEMNLWFGTKWRGLSNAMILSCCSFDLSDSFFSAKLWKSNSNAKATTNIMNPTLSNIFNILCLAMTEKYFKPLFLSSLNIFTNRLVSSTTTPSITIAADTWSQKYADSRVIPRLALSKTDGDQDFYDGPSIWFYLTAGVMVGMPILAVISGLIARLIDRLQK